MEVELALSIIKALSDGIDPFTGEEFPENSPYQNPSVVRALYIAVAALEKENTRKQRQGNLPSKAGKPWSDEEDRQLIDAFVSGISIAELSEMHQRTNGSIQSRLAKHGKL